MWKITLGVLILFVVPLESVNASWYWPFGSSQEETQEQNMEEEQQELEIEQQKLEIEQQKLEIEQQKLEIEQFIEQQELEIEQQKQALEESRKQALEVENQKKNSIFLELRFVAGAESDFIVLKGGLGLGYSYYGCSSSCRWTLNIEGNVGRAIPLSSTYSEATEYEFLFGTEFAVRSSDIFSLGLLARIGFYGLNYRGFNVNSFAFGTGLIMTADIVTLSLEYEGVSFGGIVGHRFTSSIGLRFSLADF